MTFESTASTISAWERFVAGETTLPEVRPEVLQSWHRCRDRYGVDPTLTHAPTAAEARRDVQEQSALAAELGAAAATVAARAEGYDAAITAADGEGRVLAGWGDLDTIERARAQNCAPASGWSEPMSGTSAIGTALATGGVVEISRFEHWCSGFHACSCAAVAVHDPTTAEPVGCIAITSFQDQLPGAAREWLSDAATVLQGRLRSRAASAVSELVATHRARPQGPFGSATLDIGGRIVAADDSARAALAGSHETLTRLARVVRARAERGWSGAAEIGGGGVIELEPVYSGQSQLIGILASITDPGEQRPTGTAVAGDRIAAELEDRIVLVACDEVRFVEIVDGVIWLDTDQGRMRARGRSLDEFERISAARGLMRVNRRALVNLTRIQELRPGFKGGLWVVVAGSSTPIDVARRRVPVLREALGLDPN
ncbi:MAG: LytTR family transcriptional regulator DNA-binding domain-containing protein [Actinobacteria bacterium]|nr:LytTR family transcriptional regulator DNA-binding domain-containing protein [Actinomycetota bacterium]